MLFLRALAAFLALPAIAAGVAPWLLTVRDPWRHGGSGFGWLLLAAGAVTLLWCVRDFYVLGRGTLAPWDPPRRLVIAGLYRFTRNPMYIGVLLLVTGWSLAAGSPLVGIYGAALAIGFHLRVVFGEEPALRRTFGKEWDRYAASVSRWFPTRR